MKKLVFALMITALLCSSAWAETEKCLWAWIADTGSVGTSDGPDEVHCDDGDGWASKGASYIQGADGAKTITVTFDTVTFGTVATNTLVSSGTATAAVENVNAMSVNVLGSANCSNFDAGGIFYYEHTGQADADVDTFAMTPIACFKLELETSTDTGVGTGLVWTTVTW